MVMFFRRIKISLEISIYKSSNMFRNVFDSELYSNIIQPIKKNRNSTNEILEKKFKNSNYDLY